MDVNDVTFYNRPLTVEAVRGTMGNPAITPAITIGDDIHVASDSWGRISSPSGGATYFEEIVHTRRWQIWGRIGFTATYGVASAMGAYNTGNVHNNPVENQVIILANNLLTAYRALPKGEQCGD